MRVYVLKYIGFIINMKKYKIMSCQAIIRNKVYMYMLK